MHKRMKTKNWTKEELEHLENVLKQEKKRDLLMKRSFHNFYYWTMICVIVLLNFLALLIIFPFFLIMNDNNIYFFVAAFSLLFGFMVNYLAYIADNYDLKHHIVNISISPVLSIVNYFILKNLYIFMVNKFNFTHNYNFDYIIIFFVLCFLFPYFASLIFKKLFKKK
jgi:hypothetical protein